MLNKLRAGGPVHNEVAIACHCAIDVNEREARKGRNACQRTPAHEESSEDCAKMRIACGWYWEGLHGRLQRRLMSVAMQAAPKPLSIFTTDTLGEQVLSMPNSAASPPKLAP